MKDVEFKFIPKNIGSETRVSKIENGSKIYCEGQIHAYKLDETLKGLGCVTTIGCNEAGMWSVYVNKVPKNELISI